MIRSVISSVGGGIAMTRTRRPEEEITADQIAPALTRLAEFLQPYTRLFGRVECGGHARRYVRGRLHQLERRTLEPIANEHGVQRRPLQYFVGAGPWTDAPVMDRLCDQVGAELGSSDGVFVLDSSGFPKCGSKSVGVQRQWCGRLGKEENCQVGEFLAYASPKGHTLVAYRLYLPESWAQDWARRAEAYVPRQVKFRRGWELAAEMVALRTAVLPHRWVVGDDAYGRIVGLRDRLEAAAERYLLEVPAHSRVVIGGDAAHPHAQTVAAVAQALPAGDWQRVRTRDGEKGPIEVRAAKLRVATMRGRTLGRRETLLMVTRSTGERWYYLSNARGTSVAKMVKAAACRHYVEEALATAKGEVGLDEYEVRSWTGWHHHMTLSLLAMFFLVTEQRRMKKNAGAHRRTGALGDSAAAGTAAADPRRHEGDRGADHAAAPAQRRGSSRSLAAPASACSVARVRANPVGLM
jgi:SRSO17 transposase